LSHLDQALTKVISVEVTVIKIVRVNELFIQCDILSVMAISCFVMGQKLSQFVSGDVEVEVDVQVIILVFLAQKFYLSLNS